MAILENRRRDGDHETITREQLRAVRDVLDGQEEVEEEDEEEDYTDPMMRG